MSEETARYLASYLQQYEHEWLSMSFDRNGSHNAGEYQEYPHIDINVMAELVMKFFEDLP